MEKNKIVFFVIFAVLLLSGVSFLVWMRYFNKAKPVSCTQEAKLCPDGSYTVRTEPDCEFTTCPSEALCERGECLFGNDQVGKFIIYYLLTQENFSWKTATDSRNFCVIENLNPENDLFSLYIWVRCGEFILQNGELKELSGSSGPAKINYPNELSFYDLSKFSHEVPGDGSQYSKDVKTIFPLNVQKRIFNFDGTNINKKIKAVALDGLEG